MSRQHEVEVHETLDAPIGRVWEAIDDFGAIEKFHPLVERSPIINGVERGEGAARECRFHGGGVIQERITRYEAGKGYTVRITDTGPFPLRSADADLEVHRVDSETTRVTMRMRFVPKYGPLGWLMGVAMMKPQFRKILTRVLRGLGEHLAASPIAGRQGEPVQATAS